MQSLLLEFAERREFCLCWQATAVKEPQWCCHWSALQYQNLSWCSPKRLVALGLLQYPESRGRYDLSHGYNKCFSFPFPLEKGFNSIKPGTMTVLYSLIPHLPITDHFPEQQTLTKLSHSSVFHMNSSEFDFPLKDQASKKLLTLADFLFP